MYKFLIVVLFMASTCAASQNVVIVFDDSGSMGTALQKDANLTRMGAAKIALAKSLSNLPADTKVGVVLLNGKWEASKWFIPLKPINKNELADKIKSLKPTGGTPLGGCMKAGADALLSLRQKDHYGTYQLLIVTDGEANDSNLVDKYLPDIISRGLQVQVIGLDMKSNHSLSTKVHNYRRGDDPEQITQAIAATFAETSGDDKSSAHDFETIAPIPVGMAPKLLNALTEGGNWPIGEAAPKTDQSSTAVPNATLIVSGDGNTGYIVGGIFGAIAVVGIIVFLAALANS